jgi:hypothetical protein
MYSIIAVRILNMTYAARLTPEQPCSLLCGVPVLPGNRRDADPRLRGNAGEREVAKAEVRTIDTSGTSDPLAQQPVEEVELVAAKTTWQEGTEEAVYDKRSGRLSWAIGRTETGAQ